MATIIAVNAVVLGLITAGNIMKLWLVKSSLSRDVIIEIDPRSDDRLEDADLPMYTILLPVYREAGMLKQLAGGIRALDYPRTGWTSSSFRGGRCRELRSGGDGAARLVRYHRGP